ncbi:hypothetical protein Pryu01_02061 [Paraliobacillus ryukyuensis]|uniref:Uncharacterized protein n=1 Tax=Paraliobacillus ryukyuensis TaxID=200904 RepID=A0A366E4A7_9BACI|nr:hypothetical protein [Paraliobacillus ryukyuensis]RBO97206.1 hypothetical protein DES48_107125 [Paraliobacillus ryukyuensis]
MTDEQKAVSSVLEFLHDENKKTLLVRGYDNDAKLKVVLSCLNKEFELGIIRTSSMSDISDHINRAFKRNLLPNSVKSTTRYKLGKMTVNINSYVTHTQSNPKGNENTFTLFYPIQLVLDNPKRLSRFIDELEKIKSRKIILITTNEWSIKKWDIENYMDEVFFYNVENDNPQIMRNLKNNGAI